ncbi:histidine phosphatase family protein [Candidatus Woesearchaeota archaeon]|nr:histidine phosphatase family protein [Candidatus Woesearchaeota archaeon]
MIGKKARNDLRHPSGDAPKNIFFVRHGETMWNRQGRYQGRSDIPLSSKGAIQAAKAAQWLSHYPLDMIYCSPLRRAFRTASAIAKFHPAKAVKVPALVERDYGEWEGLTLKEVKKYHQEIYNRYAQSRFSIRPPSGESLKDLTERIRPFANKLLKSKASNIAVVSHNGPLRVLKGILCRHAEEQIAEDSFDTASISIISLTNNLPELKLFNYTAHLTGRC